MYDISFVETEKQLKQVLDFCYDILGQDLREAEHYRYEDGKVLSAVLGRRGSEESLVCGFVACEAGHRRQGITKRLMNIFETEAVRAGFRYITLGSDADEFYERCGYHVINEVQGQKIYQKLL